MPSAHRLDVVQDWETQATACPFYVSIQVLINILSFYLTLSFYIYLDSLFSLKTVAPDAVKLKNPLSRYCKNISDDLLIEHTSIRLLDVIGQGTYILCRIILYRYYNSLLLRTIIIMYYLRILRIIT